MDFIHTVSLNSCYMRKQNIEKYKNALIARGGVISDEKDSDSVYIWTCAFRRDALENSVKKIRAVRAAYQEKKIYICGCMPSIAPEETKHLAEEVNAEIIPWKNEGKYFPDEALKSCDCVYAEPPFCEDVEKYKRENPGKPIAFPDSFVKVSISEGCTCNCAYCSEKWAFPPYKSFPKEDIVSRCRDLVRESGNYRIMLLADSPGEYGIDKGYDITMLMEELYALDARISIALNNFHPFFFLKYFDYFMGKICQGKISHVNLPIQSGCSSVLKKMNRRYGKADLEKIFSAFIDKIFINLIHTS